MKKHREPFLDPFYCVVLPWACLEVDRLIQLVPFLSVAYEVVPNGLPSQAGEYEVVSGLFCVAAFAGGVVCFAYFEKPVSLGPFFRSHLCVGLEGLVVEVAASRPERRGGSPLASVRL